MRSVIAALLAAFVLGGCSVADTRESGLGYVKVRSYDDVYFIDGRNEARRIEYGWDYQRAVALERIYDSEGRLLEEKLQPGLTLNAMPEELERGFEIARADPRLREVLAEPGLNMYGGFSYREPDDPACGSGSRCIHVVASAEGGYRQVAHAIVDLQSGRVVHPDFTFLEGRHKLAGETR